ncbi:MAG: metal-dependent transcriptional regulator [Chloroflexota bacterium]
MITQEREDYLKTIYKIELEESPVRTTAIAKALGVEPASVTGVIKRLAELDLLEHQPYKGVTLTPSGRKVALSVIRRHRLVELYLTQSLGYSWDEVHDEAERLEHAVSDKFIERIATILGHPASDPHGAPIPTKDGTIAPRVGHPLSTLVAGQSGMVERVSDDDPALLRYLSTLGIQPGSAVRVRDVAPYGGPIHVRIDDNEHDIGIEAASHVFIELTA